MSEIRPFDRPVVYRIRINTHLGDEWSEWFEGLNIIREPNGESLLCGLVTDQAALYGLLKKVRDMGLGLISVTRVECDGKGAGPRPVAEADVCSKCQFGKAIQTNKLRQETEVRAK
jgi:hypothetical protein